MLSPNSVVTRINFRLYPLVQNQFVSNLLIAHFLGMIRNLRLSEYHLCRAYGYKLIRSLLSNLDDFSKYIDCPRSDGKQWSVSLNDKSLGRVWLTASSGSSFSEPGSDTSGYVTAVRIESGSKYWMLCCTKEQRFSPKAQPLPTDEFCGAHLSAGNVLSVFLLF